MKLPLLSLLLGTTAAVYACAPYVQPSYLNATDNCYEIRLSKKGACKRLIDTIKDLLPPPDDFKPGTSTLEAEFADFEAALKKHHPNASQDELSKLQETFRALQVKHRNIKEHAQTFHQQLPENLIEFQLYLEGRTYLMKENPDHIPPAWKKLLELPPEKRHFRTAWVHFMLGNHFKKDLHTHYKNCRDAVRKGFADSAGLAIRSYILELRFGSNMTQMIRCAAEAENSQNAPEYTFLLDVLHEKAMSKLDDGEYFALVQDPVCREFLAVLDNSSRFRTMVKQFKLRNADFCAYYAMEDGDVTEAKEFIAILEKPTLLSIYLEAKIARHGGHTALAAEKLRQWLKMAAKIDPNDRHDILRVCEPEDSHDLSKEVYGLLGTTMVMRRDFTDAARFFHRAKQYDDLYEIAEKFMTLEQLQEFAEEIKNDTDKKLAQQSDAIRYLTARRAFREGNFRIAEKYLPENYRNILKTYLELVQKSKDNSKSSDERALALYNAAKLLRIHGMELSGTQGAPDYFPGNYGSNVPGCSDCKYDSGLGYWTLCNSHAVQVVPGFNAAKDYRNIPQHLRFHYRYIAAEMALQAGAMAKEPELKALIHYFGGNIFKHRSNLEADIFYKRLVLDSPGCALSRLADHQRWFPEVKVLIKEINSDKPCTSLKQVKELMKQAFPSAK